MSRELVKIVSGLPEPVAQAVVCTLVTTKARTAHIRGTEILRLAEYFPECGSTLRQLAIQAGFDPQAKVPKARAVA